MADMATVMATATATGMARTSSEADRHLIRSLKRLLPLSALIAFPASAAQWQVTPYLEVSQIYTDNIALAPKGQERGEWVTQLRPGVSLSYGGPKITFTATYTADLLYYASTGETTLRHEFSGGTGGGSKASWELVPDFLYFDATLDARQHTASVLGPQSQVLAASQFGSVPQIVSQPQNVSFQSQLRTPPAPGSINTTNNFATVWTAGASPYIRYDFGGEATAIARYTYSLVKSTGSGDPGTAGGALSDSVGNRLDARLESGPSYRRTRWNVAYGKEVINYSDNVADTTFERIAASVQQLIATNFALTGTVGYENNDYATAGGTTSGEFWDVGFNWTPTPRTNLSASIGERYFGPTRTLDFSHRMRLLVVNARYNQDVTTSRSLLTQQLSASTASTLDSLFLAQIPDPVARRQAVQQAITQNGLPANLLVPVDFFTNQVFLAKTWEVGVGLLGARHILFTNFYSTTRETQQAGVSTIGAGDFALSDTIKQTGVSGTWSWRVNPLDSVNLTLGYSRNKFPGIGREDDLTYFYWSYYHQFGRKLTGVLNYRRLNSDSNLGGAGSYTENAVMGSLRMTF
jgi:uncharacterized protein (PEP-CTERM system associated)